MLSSVPLESKHSARAYTTSAVRADVRMSDEKFYVEENVIFILRLKPPNLFYSFRLSTARQLHSRSHIFLCFSFYFSPAVPVATRHFIQKQMNRSGSRSNSSERPCGLSAFIPFEVDCRGKVEAFARNLQTRLHSLGSFVSSLPLDLSGSTRLSSVFSRPRRKRKPSRAPNEIHGSRRQNAHSRRR